MAISPTIRMFAVVADQLSQQPSVPTTSDRTGLALVGNTVWVLGPAAVPLYGWGGPFELLHVRTGVASIYNGTSFATAVLGNAHVPSAVTWDVSGTAWVATIENDLYNISAAGAVISRTTIPPYTGQHSGVPLGISAMTWWTDNHLYGASSLNGLLVQLQ